MKKKTITMINKRGEVIWEWLAGDVTLKFKNLLLVFAKRKNENDSEWFHYVKADYLQNFVEAKFLELIKKKKIVVDLRMHQNKTGGSRNHGTAFRIRDLNQLRACYTKCTKIL